uniref:G-protein coupled receptors family 1 profile domain-containing protein n=1 Tax=Plectus sambesii TaxID=2011161 RepID=A0A914X6B6_9BILA
MAVNQYLGVLLMAFNRFTAVVWSTKHDSIWSTRNTTIAIVLQWILPVIIVAPMSLSKFEYGYYENKGTEKNSSRLSVKFCDQNYETAYVIFGFLINLLVNVTSCIMYIAVFIGAVRHSKRYAIVSIQSTTMPTGNCNEHSQNRTRHGLTGIQQENSNVLQTSLGTMASQTAHNSRELRLAASGFIVFFSMFIPHSWNNRNWTLGDFGQMVQDKGDDNDRSA